VGVAIPRSSPINFHGGFAAATKVVTAKDLGLAIGEIIYVQGVSLQYSSTEPTVMSISIADFGVPAQGDIGGPRSSNQLSVDGAVGRIQFRNPNPTIYWAVSEDTDILCTIHSSSATAKLTFSGTLHLLKQGGGSHSVS
jgi:hypothetical protein